jgi:hypothetical protein
VTETAVETVTGLLADRRITGRVADEAAAAVTAFLDAPGTLVIRAAPDSPVPLLEIGIGFVATPGRVMNRLGVEILHEDGT